MTEPAFPVLVNLGCGHRFHRDWVNIDIASHHPEVLVHDLRRGIPRGDASCDAVYHSNLIEHIRREDALPFLRECFRVLKPGGILRVATPDLERICELYLEKLQAAKRGDATHAPDYDWMLLEMYDQTVRERSGGGMLDFLRREPLPNEPFVLDRIGVEGSEILQTWRDSPSSARPPSTLKRLFRRPRLLLEWLGNGILRLFWGSEALAALRIGRFRLSGEVHHWMYDRYSLGRLLVAAGFQGPRVCAPAESQIPRWNTFHLDALPDGTVIKPDSFFMEATKPR